MFLATNAVGGGGITVTQAGTFLPFRTFDRDDTYPRRSGPTTEEGDISFRGVEETS